MKLWSFSAGLLLLIMCADWSFAQVVSSNEGRVSLFSAEGKLIRVLSDKPFSHSPGISRDGKKVLFIRSERDMDRGDLHTVSTTGAGLRKLNPPNIEVSSAVFSPVDDHILALIDTSPGKHASPNHDLVLVEYDGDGKVVGSPSVAASREGHTPRYVYNWRPREHTATLLIPTHLFYHLETISLGSVSTPRDNKMDTAQTPFGDVESYFVSTSRNGKYTLVAGFQFKTRGAIPKHILYIRDSQQHYRLLTLGDDNIGLVTGDISNDGQRVIYDSHNSIHVWDGRTNKSRKLCKGTWPRWAN